jgi:hypothetical protein
VDYYFRKSNEVNILLKILFVINNMSKLAKKISRITRQPAFLLNVFPLPFSKSFLNRTVGTTLINIRLNAADFHYRSKLPALASDQVPVSGMIKLSFCCLYGRRYFANKYVPYGYKISIRYFRNAVRTSSRLSQALSFEAETIFCNR